MSKSILDAFDESIKKHNEEVLEAEKAKKSDDKSVDEDKDKEAEEAEKSESVKEVVGPDEKDKGVDPVKKSDEDEEDKEDKEAEEAEKADEPEKGKEDNKDKEAEEAEEAEKSESVKEVVGPDEKDKGVDPVKKSDEDEEDKEDKEAEDKEDKEAEDKEDKEAEDKEDKEAEDKEDKEAEDKEEEDKEEEDKEEDKEDTKKSTDNTANHVLETVLKSYTQLNETISSLSAQVSSLEDKLNTMSADKVKKSLEVPDLKVNGDVVSVVSGKSDSEPVGKSFEEVGEVSKSAVDDTIEVAQKGADFVDSEGEQAKKSTEQPAPVETPSMTWEELKKSFESRVIERKGKVASAYDDRQIMEAQKSFGRFVSGRSTAVDKTIIENFLNN